METLQTDPVSILDKAMKILDDALDGRVQDPNALQTALSMTQWVWTGVFSESQRTKQIQEAARLNFDRPGGTEHDYGKDK